MNYTEKQKELIIEKLEFQSERQLREAYDDMLDNYYGSVTIAIYDYCVSKALKSTDPIAYRTGFFNWLDSEIRIGIYTDEIQGEYYLQSEVDELLKSIEEEDEEND
jgi:hypothetical protein